MGFFVGACGSSSNSSGTAGDTVGGASGQGGAPSAGGPGSGGSQTQPPVSSGGMSVVAAGGMTHIVGTGGSSVGMGGMVVGMGGSTGVGGASAGGATMSAGGSSGSGNGGTAAAGAAGTTGGGGASNGSMITGTIGTLGAVKPIVSAWVISNSGETLIYLSTAPLTCMMMQTMGAGWLPTLPAGSQVIEIVVKGAPMVKTYPVGLLQGEVNYAPGGKSSAYETNATGGSITFTSAMANGPVAGSVMATYAMGSIMGTFQANFCAMGSQY